MKLLILFCGAILINLSGYAQAKFPADTESDYTIKNYPAPYLSKIKAPLFAINSADDQVNPPELQLMEKNIGTVKRGRYILLPVSDKTSGHGTHSNPAIWGSYLQELLALTANE